MQFYVWQNLLHRSNTIFHISSFNLRYWSANPITKIIISWAFSIASDFQTAVRSGSWLWHEWIWRRENTTIAVTFEKKKIAIIAAKPVAIRNNFWSQVNIWNVKSARAKAFVFDTGTGVLVKVSNLFETGNVSSWGGLETPIFGFMPNALTCSVSRARHLLTHVFEYWLWRYRYFWSKVYIWNVNCARATAFIFDTRTGVFVKVYFFRQKMSRPEGTRTPTLRIHAECSSLLSYQGQTFVSLVFEYWPWW